jgi:hypothetical protein
MPNTAMTNLISEERVEGGVPEGEEVAMDGCRSRSWFHMSLVAVVGQHTASL